MRTTKAAEGSISQRDIAKRTGLSLMQVSRVLNDHPSVAQKTRQRVLEVAREIGYESTTNLHARRMAATRHGKRQRTGTIAVLLPDAAFAIRDSYYFGPILAGIEEEIVARGDEMIMATYPLHAPPEKGLPRLVREGEVDGVINLNFSDEVLRYLEVRRIPRVSVAQESEYAHSIRPDDARGIGLATKHLLNLGHRKLAYLGLQSTSPVVNLRQEAFALAVAAAGVEKDCLVLSGLSELREDLLAQQMRLAMQTIFFTKSYTGLVCYNDAIAMQAVRELEMVGMHVPEDISVTGFDDYTKKVHFHPAITSVAFESEAMGRRAVSLLVEVGEAASAEGEPGTLHSPISWRREIVPVILAVRESTARVCANTNKPNFLEVK